MNPKVDFYFTKNTRWLAELEHLRQYVLESGLTEELKWGVPCYTFDHRNIVLLHVFKDYCALLFFKGALLGEAHGILVQQTANTQATRQIRFTSVKEIVALEGVIKAYLREAVEVEQSGAKVPFKKADEFTLPSEFESKLAESPALKSAFAALTPGRQRAYLLYFSAPKQATTRSSRVAKYEPQILKGRGLHD
jgi:uncharacterized protein YdeI (YjbR/CyaY-like superfamily)